MLCFHDLGVLSIASYSYLISITQRKEVAQILGKPIYAITNVAIIPLSSQADASRAILQAQKISKQAETETEQSSVDEDEDLSACDADSGDEGILNSPAVNFDNQEEPEHTRVAQNVIGNKGRNGRFVLNWFSRKPWGLAAAPQKPSSLPNSEVDIPDTEETRVNTPSSQPLAEDSDIKTEAEATRVVQEAVEKAEALPQVTPSKALELMPKLLRYTKLIFASNNFFFSYDYDLTRQYCSQDPKAAQLPLHVHADPLV
jgi:SacI homology domain